MVSRSPRCFFGQGDASGFLELKATRRNDVERGHDRACFGANVGDGPRCCLAGAPVEECLGTKEFGRRRRSVSIIPPIATTTAAPMANKILPTLEPPEPFVNCSPSTAVGGGLP